MGRAGLEARVARAAGSPLIRGGLTIVAGIVTGNILGFFRVALTAYFLGTKSAADSLAVAIGPIDPLNQALINTIIFGFVPMLTERQGGDRIALFLKVNRLFARFFLGLTAAILVLAPQLIRVLAPGLPADFVPQAIAILRITDSGWCVLVVGWAKRSVPTLAWRRGHAPDGALPTLRIRHPSAGWAPGAPG